MAIDYPEEIEIQYYDGSKSRNSRDLFYKKAIYKLKISDSNATYGVRNIIDFNNFSEKILYGRVNHDFIPIQVRNPRLYITRLPTSFLADPKSNLRSANMLVGMFANMRRIFNSQIQAGTITRNDKYLSEPRIYKAYMDLDSLYEEYFTVMRDALVEQMKENIDTWGKKGFQDAKTFATTLMGFLEGPGRVYPFTKVAFAKSRFCPMHISGLVIEIADLKVTDDQTKIDEFVKSDNWEVYVRAANQSGFMIDANVPWRLVLDVAPVAVRDLCASLNGANTVTSIFSTLYQTCHGFYLRQFYRQLYQLYTAMNIQYMRSTEGCVNTHGGSRLPWEYYAAPDYTMDEFRKELGLETFLKMYFSIRFAEEESHFTEAEKKSIIDDSIALCFVDNLGHVEAVNYFERIINKTFDYRGSASYIFNNKEGLLANNKKVPTPREVLKESNIGNPESVDKLYGATSDPIGAGSTIPARRRPANYVDGHSE